MRRLAAALLVVSTAVAGAQTPRNGPEWGGKNHQPTQAGVAKRESRAGVQAPVAERQENGQAVDRLGQQLLHDETVDPPRNPARPLPP
jgi:hypothetical protein